MDQLSRGLKGRLVLGVSTFALMTTGVSAQESADDRLVIDEVIVTAQRREESLQDVPVAIVAFDAAFQQRVNLDDAKDLIKFSPGFSGNSQDSFIDRVSVRGISTNDFGVGGDPSVGFFKNGFYQGRNGVAVTSNFDLERAEVARGPQGFLFGRNAIAGAISLHTAQPNFDDTEGFVEVGIGEREIYEFEGAVSRPFGENLAVRLAAYYSHEDGYVSNAARPNDDNLIGHEKFALRATIATRGENWDATLIGEYEDREQDGSVYRYLGTDASFEALQDRAGLANPPEDFLTINSDNSDGSFDRGEIYNIAGTFNYDLDFARITVMSQWREHTYDYAEDFDGTPLRINSYLQDQEGEYFEADARIVSDTDGPLSWYAGVSVYSEEIDTLFTNAADEDAMCLYYYYGQTCAEAFAYYGYGTFTNNPAGLVEQGRVNGDYWGWGVYVDARYELTDKLSLGAGVRYNYDEKTFSNNVFQPDSELGPYFTYGFFTNGAITDTQDWDDFTPRFTLTYAANDNLTAYGQVSRGYKSGGFASFGIEQGADGVDDDGLALPGARPDAFDPETVWSYEVGMKGALFDRRLRYDIAAYYYDYTDLQLSFFENGAGTRVANIGQVDGYGLEATVQATLNQYMDLYVGVTWQDSEVEGAEQVCDNCDGNRLIGQPEFILAGAVNFHYPITSTGEFTSTIDWRAQTDQFGGLENSPFAVAEGYTDVSLRVGYRDEAGWQLIVYAENLFDAEYFDNVLEGGGIIPAAAIDFARPLTIGVQGTVRFGG